MKIEKNKHDHKLTHLLKVGIFAMLMIAPLFASCSQLLYVTFNKNAYQSYTESTYIVEQPIYYETNEVENYNDFIVGNIYHYKDNFNPVQVDGAKFLVDIETTSNIVSQFNLTDDVTQIRFYITTTGAPYLQIVKTNSFSYIDVSNTPFDFVVHSISANITYIDNIINYFSKSEMLLAKEYIQVQQNGTLDNAFYYGVEKMTESPLFNWTQNTALYTGIKAMTDNLQVQTNVIAVLVTYWTILTIIYIIIDIVLALFTKMTHLLVRSD